MAITIDWATKVINVNKADMILLQSTPTEIYQLNMDFFHNTLRDLEDDAEGIVFDTTHVYVGPIAVGGVVLARVVEIINGYTVTFEDGQYRVNLTGANTNLADVTNVNQVSVSSSNSAGLQDLSTLLSAAFQGEVCVSPSRGQAGTTVPLGTRSTPVNNLADAKAIAEREGLHQIRIMETMTIENVDFSGGYRFTSDSPATILITVDPTANLQNCDFEFCYVQGDMSGNNIYRQCLLGDVEFTSGFIFQCSLFGTVKCITDGLLAIFDCYSNTLAGQPNPKIDFNGTGELILRNYSGVIELHNHTDTSGDGDVCIDMASGVVIVDSSCTAGFMPIRGIARVDDFSTGTCNVVDLTINQSIEDNAASLNIINQGVQKSSLLIPHTAEL